MRDDKTFSFFPLIGPIRVLVPCFSSSQIREAGFSLLFLRRRFKHCFPDFPEYFLSAKTRPQKMPLFFLGLMWAKSNCFVFALLKEGKWFGKFDGPNIGTAGHASQTLFLI